MKTLLKTTLMVLAIGLLIGGCKKTIPPQEPPQPSVIASAVAQTPDSPPAETQPAEKTAPAFTLTDQNGKSHSLSDYKDKIVVLAWINPDCPFVKRHYDKGTFDMADEYAAKGVIWLAMNSTNYFDVEKNLKFAEERGVKYPVLDDHSGTVGRLYKAKTTPHMFIIDKNGLIAYQGAIDDDPQGDKTEIVNYVRQALDQMLAGEKITMPETKPYGCSVKYAE